MQKIMQIKNNYSFCQKLRLAYWLVRTKLICRRARLIRFPFDLRNAKYIDLGDGLTTGVGCRLEAYSSDGKPTLHFGRNVQINDYVHICAMECVSIGDNVLMAGHVYISDNSHGSYKGDENDCSPDVSPAKRSYPILPVTIEDNVWLGEGVVILPGVIIGRGSVIGANSVVTKSIPEYTIAVGQPAKGIKTYNFDTKKWQRIL